MATPNILTSIHGRAFGIGPDGSLILNGSRISGPQSALWAGAPSIGADPSTASVFYDDFINQASATASDYHTYTSMDDGATGTNAFQGVPHGVYNVVTAAAQDDYHAMRTVAKSFQFLAGKEVWFGARFKLAEATVNDAAWWFGFGDTTTTGGLQTGASGPLASYDGALIWKDQDTMTINFETSNAGTQNTTTAMATVVTDTWTRVGFYFDGTATTGIVTPYYEVTGVAGAPMLAGTPQNITLASSDAAYLIFGVKAGPGGAAETLQVDYLKVVQMR